MEYFATAVKKAERFYKNRHQLTDPNFHTISGGLEVCSEKYHLKRNSYLHHTIEILISGAIQFSILGKTHNINPGMVFIHTKNTPHEIKNNGSNTSKYFISVEGSRAESILHQIINKHGYVFALKDISEVLHTFKEITTYGVEQDLDSQTICNQLSKIALLKLLKKGIQLKELSNKNLLDYQKIKSNLKEKFLDFKTVDDIAISHNMTNVKVCKLFKKYDEQTPYQYLTQLKMNYALELLNINNNSIKTIAYNLGFDNPFNFSRSFKNHFGLSPKAYKDSVSD